MIDVGIYLGREDMIRETAKGRWALTTEKQQTHKACEGNGDLLVKPTYSYDFCFIYNFFCLLVCFRAAHQRPLNEVSFCGTNLECLSGYAIS